MNHAIPETLPDELVATIADDRRRQVLRVLLETPGAVSLDGLAAEIARREDGDETSHTVERIKVTLYHSHLPALADVGLVAYIAHDDWMDLAYIGSPETTALLSDLLAVE